MPAVLGPAATNARRPWRISGRVPAPERTARGATPRRRRSPQRLRSKGPSAACLRCWLRSPAGSRRAAPVPPQRVPSPLCSIGWWLCGSEVRDLLVDLNKLVAQVREDARAVVAEEQKHDAEDRERVVDRIDPVPEFRRFPPAAGGIGDRDAGRGPQEKNKVRRAHAGRRLWELTCRRDGRFPPRERGGRAFRPARRRWHGSRGRDWRPTRRADRSARRCR
jgi:hypothetical protein